MICGDQHIDDRGQKLLGISWFKGGGGGGK